MNFGNLSIETHRFLLRPLVVADASQEYLSWMRDDVAAQYIVAAASTQSLESLERYILEKTTKIDCLFLGIFHKKTGSHIGNIKYEPICFEHKEAVMGVLLGDATWRGKNVFTEIFLASQKWLSDTYSINTIRLGVERSNTAAIRAYEKAGFISCDDGQDTTSSSVTMATNYIIDEA
jgi:ribosomal-protein-alanine N-acetyltransferase